MREFLMISAALMLALGACTQGMTRPQQEFVNQLNRQAREREAPFLSARDATRQQLALFQQEPNRSCRSPHLARASADTGDTLDKAVSAYTNAVYEAAELMLDIADAAADAGCPAEARSLYREVISTFTGSSYAAYRQRAEIGMAEIRGQ